MRIFKPTEANQVEDIVSWAVSEERPLEIRGAGSKQNLGRPMEEYDILDCTGLSGISYYEPGELVLSAYAGTLMSDIDRVLAENDQRLAFEPMDYGYVLGQERGQATIGGITACNISGPRRVHIGAARDHCLGVNGVSGWGKAFKSGGRVVKNVTGYDLSKLLTGSYGTLAALTEVTFKVLPVPESVCTILVFDLQESDGISALSQALSTSVEPTGLAHIPKTAASRSDIAYVSEAGKSVTAIRIEGPNSSVQSRSTFMQHLFGKIGITQYLAATDSHLLWREIGEVKILPHDEGVLWKISVAPTSAPSVVEDIKSALGRSGRAEALFDWAGGLIWLHVIGAIDGGHKAVRSAISEGGHATLIRSSKELRSRIPVFHPQVQPLAALAMRVKKGFDPNGILNPFRMSVDY